jgi:hypothetical protein
MLTQVIEAGPQSPGAGFGCTRGVGLTSKKQREVTE